MGSDDLEVDGGLRRAAHPDQVQGQAASAGRSDLVDDVAPQIRGGRVAVQKEHWVAFAGLDVVKPAIEHFDGRQRFGLPVVFGLTIVPRRSPDSPGRVGVPLVVNMLRWW